MFSGTRGLGYPQALRTSDQWYDADNDVNSDIDLISVELYSPPAGYPPQRIMEYDVPLAQHQTLNGVGLGTTTRSRLRSFFAPLVRTQRGEPVRPTAIQPRHAVPAAKVLSMAPSRPIQQPLPQAPAYGSAIYRPRQSGGWA